MLAKKRRGPPPTGKGVQVVVRLQPDPLAALDKWAEKQPDRPTRAEAIRRLVEIGLSGQPSVRPRASSGAARAASVIEKHIDASAPAEERESRKRRLLKGPSVFRDVRVDRTKK